MTKLTEFIESGILELYAAGQASVQEVSEVEFMLNAYPEVRSELNEINIAIEKYALHQAITPDPTVKPFLLATVDYIERLEQGEALSEPPLLHKASKMSDYAEWIDRKDLQLDKPVQDIKAHIIANTSAALTAFVWLKDGAPPEIHKDVHENFLILEGTCDITIGDVVHSLVPGDLLSIPLHISHFVKVTSDIPCKIILQRIAA